MAEGETSGRLATGAPRRLPWLNPGGVRTRALILLGATALAAALLPATAGAQQSRYALANGCYALQSKALGRFVDKAPGGGYSASAGAVGGAESFRMQATDLGRYLFYGRQGDFMAASPPGLPGADTSRVAAASEPSELADWRVDPAGGGAFRVALPARGRVLAVTGGGDLALAESGSAGDEALFTFARAGGCATFPESDVSATGGPYRGPTSYGEVRGTVDGHMHLMAFEFLGGRAHCGRPWHPFGVAHAMVDCPDHGPAGSGAVLENALANGGRPSHDTVGWPTFRDWPRYDSLTHEGAYYRWLERAWLGGLRVFVNLAVDNAALCDVYPHKADRPDVCNEMATVRLELRRIHELQDYIDAQHGGPGRGWFRIVADPFQARRVINQGKLAVVLGIETSKLFDCGLENDVPECDRAQIDRQLDEVHRMGVRSMLLINKFDNAFGGVAGDAGTTGVVTNTGNRYETGRYWQLQTCTGEAEDKPQYALPGQGRDSLIANGLQAFLPPGTAPVYPSPPHCNMRGLSELGEHLVRRMMQRGMIIDPDHLSVLARNHLLTLLESRRYSGVTSSHSWSTNDSYPRIYRLGGFISPYAGDSEGFVREWRKIKPMRDPRFYFGFGFGADMNGFGTQGGPRRNAPNPVTYPFRSIDGAVTLHRHRTGQRTWDINVDGVSQYGLYPDWMEDLRRIAGNEIAADMARGAEAYLQTWERAVGIPANHCRGPRGVFTAGGMGHVRLRAGPEQVLRRAGQPATRVARVWTWCVADRRNRGARVAAVFTPQQTVGLVTSTGRDHRVLNLGTGARAARLRGRARPFGRGLLMRPAGRNTRVIFGVRRGRISWIAVATRSVAASPGRLRPYLRLAGLR
jgi:hypothetical protein